jgi:C-terminal processing protease CtpA/Prc
MKKILKWLKWTLVPIVVLVFMIIIPIGINKAYESLRASKLTDQERKIEDLDRLEYLFKNEFAGYNVFPTTQVFDEKLGRLRKEVIEDPNLNQEVFNMEVLKLVASFKDPHTGIFSYLDRRYPFSLAWSDGYFYLLGGQIDKKWLGAKVVKFGNTTSQEVFDKISAYTSSPNEAGTAYFVEYFIPYSAPLFHEGISKDKDSILLEVSKNGKNEVLTFNSMSKAEVAVLPDYYRMSDISEGHEVSLYKRNPQKIYWYEYDESDQLLYLRYRQCVDQGDIEGFWDEVFEKIKEYEPSKFVIDVRGNPGGDSQSHISFLNRIQKDTIVNQKGRLFTLIDRGTGSAAVNFANDMERLTASHLVGEKTIDTPNTTADPTFFTLPHSKIKIMIPNLYAFNSHLHDRRDAIIPDIPIVQNLEEEAYYRDEVLDSIRKFKLGDESHRFAQLPASLEGQYSFSKLRNLALKPSNGRWYITIDGLIESPIYQNDTMLYTLQYDLSLSYRDSVASELELGIHQSTLKINRIDDKDVSIEKLLAEGSYTLAKDKLTALKNDGRFPFYIDRPFFQTKTYEVYNELGFDKAFELNKMTKEFFPDDPVTSIVDFELYQYEGRPIGQFKSLFPIVGKLLKRYYTVLTTDRIMNDDYNAFIGK